MQRVDGNDLQPVRREIEPNANIISHRLQAKVTIVVGKSGLAVARCIGQAESEEWALTVARLPPVSFIPISYSNFNNFPFYEKR